MTLVRSQCKRRRLERLGWKCSERGHMAGISRFLCIVCKFRLGERFSFRALVCRRICLHPRMRNGRFGLFGRPLARRAKCLDRSMGCRKFPSGSLFWIHGRESELFLKAKGLQISKQAPVGMSRIFKSSTHRLKSFIRECSGSPSRFSMLGCLDPQNYKLRLYI